MIKLKSILNEINFYNRKDFIENLIQLVKDCTVQASNTYQTNILRWFETQFVKWIFSPVDDQEKKYMFDLHNDDKHEWKEGEPEWAKDKSLYNYKGFLTFDHLVHVIDFFLQMNEDQIKRIHGM